MTDATPTSEDGNTADFRVPVERARRRRWMGVGALIAIGVALGGGVAAGVAAVVSHSSSTAAGGGATGSASLFFPVSGNQGQAQPGVTVDNATSRGAGVAGVVMGAPAQAPSAAFSPALSQGVAMSSSIAYPYPGGWCNGVGPQTAAGPGITATGLAQITLPASPQTAQTLNVGVQSNNTTDNVGAAITDAQQRLAAIRDALHKAGVPDSQITQQGLSVYANGSPKPSNVNVNGNISATITDPAVLDRALQGVAAAGANNVNVWSNSGATGTQPDEKSLQSAIAKASDAARTSAQSQAQAAGVSLGSLQSSQAQPPSICGWGPGGAQMVVAVTLTYAIK